MRVVLDTSILRRDLRLKGTSFRVLAAGLRSLDLSLHIPRVVLDEIGNLFREELRGQVIGLRRLTRHLESLTGRTFAMPVSDDEVEELREQYEGTLHIWLDGVGARILAIPGFRTRRSCSAPWHGANPSLTTTVAIGTP